MRYAKFGNTDIVASEIALGTWGIGGASWDDNSEDTRLDAIRSAVESGINFIDTAPAYNGAWQNPMWERLSVPWESGRNCTL